MRVLVTGASGMIGSAVLRRTPRSVVALRAQMGSIPDPAGTGAGWPPLEAAAVCDICDRGALASLVDGVDVVIHLAGPPSVADSFRDPAGSLRAHVLGTEAVVGLCLDHGVGRLVQVSSAEVYGRPTTNPVDESALLAPRSPYAAAKVGAEAIVAAATRAGPLDAVVLRPFSIYGPGQRRGSLLGVILGQVLAAEPVRVRASDAVRDYCYVDDLAGAIWLAAASNPAGCQVLNVAAGRGTSVAELARAAREATGEDRDGEAPVTIEATSDRPAEADIVELVGDVGRIERRLGWRATTSLGEGLARTLDWCTAGEPSR